MQWKQENDVDDFVQASLETIGLVKLKDFNVQNGMSEYMRSALQGSAKTKDKTKTEPLSFTGKFLMLRLS